MSEIQTLVHRLESGMGRVWMWRVALVAVVVGVAIFYFSYEFNGFEQAQAMESAQMGRNLARGNGYTTRVIRPLSLGQLTSRAGGEKIDLTRVPETTMLPVYPALLAAVYKISGTNFEIDAKKLADEVYYQPEVVTVTLGLLFTVLSGLLLFWLAHRVFDSRVAWLTVFAFAGCDLIWKFGISGLSTSFVFLLITVVFFCLHETLQADEVGHNKKAFLWCVAGAAALSLAVLTKGTVLALLPAFLLVLLIACRRGTFLALIVAVAVLAPIVAWSLRTIALTGNPLGTEYARLVSFDTTGDFTQLEREFQTSRDPGWWKGLPGIAKAKFYAGLGHFMENGFNLMGDSVVALFFLVGLMHPFRRRRAKWLRIFTLIAAFFLVAGPCLLTPKPAALGPDNNLIFMWPGVALFGSAFFFILLDRLEIHSRYLRFGAALLFLVVCAAPMIATLNTEKARFPYPPYFSPIIKSACDFLSENEIIMSDMPWATAWYGDRYSILVTKDFKEFFKINDALGSINGLLLTPITINRPLIEIDFGENKDWATMIRRQEIPREFPLHSFTGLPTPGMGNRAEYLFFSDRQRW